MSKGIRKWWVCNTSGNMLSLYVIPVYLGVVSFVYDTFPYVVNPERVIRVYNMFQVAINAPTFLILFYLLCSQASNPFFINVPKTDLIRTFTIVHYLTKYLDLIDTLFIALKKSTRQLSFLHVYHHVSILFIWEYLVMNDVHDGTIGTPAMVNSFVHTVMYFHYMLQSHGIKHKYKHWITRIQLTQFVYCFFHSIAMLWYETVMPKEYALIQLVYQVQMLYLFGKFYMKNYK